MKLLPTKFKEELTTDWTGHLCSLGLWETTIQRAPPQRGATRIEEKPTHMEEPFLPQLLPDTEGSRCFHVLPVEDLEGL